MRKIKGSKVTTFGYKGYTDWNCEDSMTEIVDKIASGITMVRLQFNNQTYYLNANNIIAVREAEFEVDR